MRSGTSKVLQGAHWLQATLGTGRRSQEMATPSAAAPREKESRRTGDQEKDAHANAASRLHAYPRLRRVKACHPVGPIGKGPVRDD